MEGGVGVERLELGTNSCSKLILRKPMSLVRRCSYFSTKDMVEKKAASQNRWRSSESTRSSSFSHPVFFRLSFQRSERIEQRSTSSA